MAVTDTRSIALCPRDGAPLISTIAFPKAEFYCLDCGGRFGFFDPDSGEPTPELRDRLEAAEAQWDEHVGDRLIPPRSWRIDCDLCAPHTEYHAEHATEQERAADAAARLWLEERKR